MGGGAAGGGDCEGDFNVVGADIGHGFGKPCAVDCIRDCLHFVFFMSAHLSFPFMFCCCCLYSPPHHTDGKACNKGHLTFVMRVT